MRWLFFAPIVSTIFYLMLAAIVLGWPTRIGLLVSLILFSLWGDWYYHKHHFRQYDSKIGQRRSLDELIEQAFPEVNDKK